MAQLDINTIRRIHKERNRIHERVQTTYTTFENEGKKYLQFDTYGKAGRDFPEKISQSIQFDQDSAQFIVNLLTQEFIIK